MRQVSVILTLTLLFLPTAAGLSLTVHSPEPGATYNVSAPLNYSTDTAANITKTYGVGNGSHHANTTGESKLIYGDGSHVLTLKAVAFSNGSEQAAAQVPFTIQNGSHSPTEITGCADLVSSGTYELVNDITTNPRQTCMELQQSDFDPRDITLDCQGHIIDGVDANGQVGVKLSGDVGTCFSHGSRVVKNCRFTNYCHAIDTVGAADIQGFYTVKDNEFVSGAPYQRCGAIHANDDGAITVTGNRFEGNAASFSGFFIGGLRYDCRPNLAYNNLFQDQRFATDFAISEHMQWFVSPRPGDRVTGSGQVGGNAYTTPTGTGFSDTCTDSDGDGFCDSNFNVKTQQPTSATGSFIDQHPLTAGPVAPPEIEDTSFTLSPFPAETGENVTASIVVARADNVTVQTRVDGDDENHTVTGPAAGDTWNITLPEQDTPGTRVDVTVFARNPAGTDVLGDTVDAYPATELPVGGDAIKSQLHYFVFNETRTVPVVLARFADQFVYNETEFDNRSEVRQWERAREFDINSYYGSGRGSMGAIGFDFRYRDNSLEFFELGERAVYEDEANLSDIIQFSNDGQGNTSVETPFIISHPGLPIGAAQFIPAFRHFGGRNIDEDYRIYSTMTKGDHYGVWSHELGHFAEELNDLYSNDITGDVEGGIGPFGLMGTYYGTPRSEEDSQLPQPFTSMSRSALNNGDWLSSIEIEIESLAPSTAVFKSVSSHNLGDSIFVLSTRKQNINDDTIKYIVEPRGINDIENGSVVIFKVSQSGENPIAKANVLSNPFCFRKPSGHCTLDELGRSEEDLFTNDSALFANFTLIDESGLAEEYNATVKIEVIPEEQNRRVVALDDPIRVDSASNSTKAPLNLTVPDIDLQAIDSKGRVVGGKNNGTYVNEIPRARWSNERIQGLEWISVPDNSSAQFRLDATDLLQFADDKNLSEDQTSKLIQTAHITVISYGENPQLIENKTAVNDTVFQDLPVSVRPGEKITVALPAEIDFGPNTVNMRSNSRWVTVFIELPDTFGIKNEDGENISTINISAIRLNGEVPAIDNEKFGFVKEPELKDGDNDGLLELMVKFNGDLVRNTIDVGEEKITITGKTTTGKIFTGTNSTRVINSGAEKSQGDDLTGMVVTATNVVRSIVTTSGNILNGVIDE